MRLTTFMLAAGLLLGCTNTDAPPPFFDMDYQVRCKGDCNNAFDNESRTISHLDDEEGYRVDCNVAGSGADRSLNARFVCPDADSECGGDYSFEVSDLRIGGSDPGSGCRVFVTEGANIYEGECTATEPTADKPCQISAEENGGDINGTVRCINISNVAASSQRRGVFSPASENDALFNILNCSGL